MLIQSYFGYSVLALFFLKTTACIKTTQQRIPVAGTLDRSNTNSPSVTDNGNPGAQPLVLIKSKYQAGEVTALCDQAIKDTEARLAEIAAVAPENRNFDNTMLALEN